MGEETRERAKGKGGHDGGTGAEHRGDSGAVRRMGDAVGIISKRPLYPGCRTEEPVCMCVCVCVLGFAPVVPGVCSFLRPHILTSSEVSQPRGQHPTPPVRSHEIYGRRVEGGFWIWQKKKEWCLKTQMYMTA